MLCLVHAIEAKKRGLFPELVVDGFAVNDHSDAIPIDAECSSSLQPHDGLQR